MRIEFVRDNELSNFDTQEWSLRKIQPTLPIEAPVNIVRLDGGRVQDLSNAKKDGLTNTDEQESLEKAKEQNESTPETPKQQEPFNPSSEKQIEERQQNGPLRQEALPDKRAKRLPDWKISLESWVKAVDPSSSEGQKRTIAAERITTAGEEFEQELDLSSLGLTSLPSNLPPNLRAINLSHNQLTSAPQTLRSRNHRLESVDLSYNQISSIGEEDISEDCSGLRSLNLSHNQISSCNLVHLGKRSGLSDLDLSYNRIGSPNDCKVSLPGLQKLDLSHNEIASIAEEQGAISSKELALSDNPIKNSSLDRPSEPVPQVCASPKPVLESVERQKTSLPPVPKPVSSPSSTNSSGNAVRMDSLSVVALSDPVPNTFSCSAGAQYPTSYVLQTVSSPSSTNSSGNAEKASMHKIPTVFFLSSLKKFALNSLFYLCEKLINFFLRYQKGKYDYTRSTPKMPKANRIYTKTTRKTVFKGVVA